ncbi:hypothetical protein SHKM778_21570 [Streptomyces sp. KM77-8]|uniref:PDZ domain-containing protein n=1 Tax=Streptomyces haneummycinicus TaxID=3074435 RepID=A0AAT9HEG1_9ACTN
MRADDRIVAFAGVRTDDWTTLSDLIRDSAGKSVPIVVERDGRELTLQAKIATNLVAKKDGNGTYVEGEYVKAGFLGFSAATGVVRQDFGDSVTWMTDRVGDAVDSSPPCRRRSPRCGTRPSATAPANPTPRWASSARPGSAARSPPSTSPPHSSSPCS